MRQQPEVFRSEDIDRWAATGLISPDQAAAIRADLAARAGPADQPGEPVAGVEATAHRSSPPSRAVERRPGLNFVTIAYYFGGFLILLAYTVFLGLQWESLAAVGQAAILAVTIGGLWGVGGLLRRRGFPEGGGLLVFAGTGIVPLLVYTIQQWTGLWPEEASRADAYEDFYRRIAPAWIAMEVVSIAVACLVLWRVRLPLLTLLIAFWGWYLSMDLARWARRSDGWSWDTPEQAVGAAVGVAMLALGTALDRRGLRPYRRWFYIFGTVVVFGHLCAFWSRYEDEAWSGPTYLLASLALVVASVWLQARVPLIFGALGCYAYVSYLAFDVFEDALGFVFALAGIGLFIVLSAVGYQRFGQPWLERTIGRGRAGPPRLSA
jgi:hypothetical protein